MRECGVCASLTGIARDEVEGVEVGELVAAVNLNRLQETNRHPQPDHYQMVA